MKFLNLGILAHVDAGKTSLTERLLYTAGVISEMGSVDAGNTQTDSLALERQRGITIKSAVASFVIGDTRINLIDTPGHPEFIAEVERVLSVLDGVVLVISAVEGVQSQTRVLMRTLQRLHIPTLMFVNKIDRRGARYDGVLREIAGKLTPAIVPMGFVSDSGTRDARFTPYSAGDENFVVRLANVLAEHDDALLAALVNEEAAISYSRLQCELAAQSRRALVHPVFFGSAITGAGVDELFGSIPRLLPTATGDAASPVSGTVFKIERGQAGEKMAYVRLFSGTIHIRDHLHFGQNREGKVTAISVFDSGTAAERTSIVAGEIGKLKGLRDIQIGDTIGASRAIVQAYQFALPTLETAIVPLHVADKGKLHAALEQLAEQDPLINLRQDDLRQELYVSLYGEVQKEVIQDTLASDFGVEAEFRKTSTLYVERPNGTGEAVEKMREAANPFLATVGLRVEPAAPNSGIEFRLSPAVPGKMPLAFFKAVEDTVYETLGQGLYGWQVIDCKVTITHAGYLGKHGLGHQYFNKSMSSTGEDFRGLTPLVIMEALKQAGTTVCEPMHHFELEIPAESLNVILPVLTHLGAVPHMIGARGSSYVLQGIIPAGQIHELQQQLPALTSGEGVLESAFAGYQEVHDEVPTRHRTDNNPLDRKAYLLRLGKRV